jgi:hypothetical protein
MPINCQPCISLVLTTNLECVSHCLRAPITLLIAAGLQQPALPVPWSTGQFAAEADAVAVRTWR